MGGGRQRAHHSTRPHHHTPPMPPPVIPAPFPSFLRRQEPTPPPATPHPLSVIPAQAGTRTPSRHSYAPPFRHSCAGRNPHHHTHPPPPPPFPNSSLPPFRGEARWGVGGNEHTTAPATTTTPLPRPLPHPLSVIPAQAGTRAPSRHSRTPPPSFLRRQEHRTPTPPGLTHTHKRDNKNPTNQQRRIPPPQETPNAARQPPTRPT